MFMWVINDIGTFSLEYRFMRYPDKSLFGSCWELIRPLASDWFHVVCGHRTKIIIFLRRMELFKTKRNAIKKARRATFLSAVH